MNATERLQTIFTHVIQSEHSSFYRDFYTRHGLAAPHKTPLSIAEWEALPFLTKKDLIAVPFERRLFVPFENAGVIRMTSGTSGAGILLFPRNDPSRRAEFEGMCSRMLTCYFPQHPTQEWGRSIGINTVSAVPGDLPASARLAERYKIDGIGAAPNLLVALIPYLRQVMDTRRVRFIVFYGGYPSEAQFAELDAAFPNARIRWEYATTEGNGKLGRSCEDFESERTNHIHMEDSICYAELIDPDTLDVIREDEREGELVITTVWTENPLPILRYRTGDLAKRMKNPETCSHSQPLYQILGRVEFDRCAIPGGELRSSEIERALRPFAHLIHSDYELHVHERPAGQPWNIILRARPRDTATLDPRALLCALAENVRIGAQRTLESSIEDKLIAPIECDLIREVPDSSRRLTRIRKHSE